MKVQIVSSGRADGSPLQPVAKALAAEGITVRQKKIGGWPPSDALFAIQHEQAERDLVLLLGDRYETLAAALGATIAQVPIAHIHGGEATFGSFDNQIRDAISKLSHIHFVAAPEYRIRLREIGEDPEHIYVVGAPGLDMLVDLPSRISTKTLICTYHPCTAVEESIAPLLEALDRFPEYEQIWTGVNNDPGGGSIREALAGRHIATYSPRGYLEACRQAAAVVGNSSSGIIEAPSLGVPSVNAGRRQEGRLSGPSVLDCFMLVESIVPTITAALEYDGPFDNPYGGPGASARIAKILAETELEGIRVKIW